jgi:Rod binding domain-containing protein
MLEELSFRNTLADRSWQSATDDRSLNDLKHPSGKDGKRIADSARAFESLLLGKWLEAAEESLGTVPGGTEEDQESNPIKQFSALAVQSLAQGITGAGGIGISNLLIKGLESRTTR